MTRSVYSVQRTEPSDITYSLLLAGKCLVRLFDDNLTYARLGQFRTNDKTDWTILLRSNGDEGVLFEKLKTGCNERPNKTFWKLPPESLGDTTIENRLREQIKKIWSPASGSRLIEQLKKAGTRDTFDINKCHIDVDYGACLHHFTNAVMSESNKVLRIWLIDLDDMPHRTVPFRPSSSHTIVYYKKENLYGMVSCLGEVKNVPTEPMLLAPLPTIPDFTAPVRDQMKTFFDQPRIFQASWQDFWLDLVHVPLSCPVDELP
eukprot:Protomagalhaensia_wolfi_Nauph_80__3288@NODE_3348_length_819_cov_4_137179_g2626_i0_p1_GENE_NODE_3348_length_819_cov_4_137179_g2626_i0NODE_3348_length_819_cov_4_137179_g2626_i0_p1_ORF_typecomplete_len261_score31_70DUF4523/PF15023_6/0_22_NODE_3348_length_819_cov_4_137179_g2626_i09791